MLWQGREWRRYVRAVNYVWLVLDSELLRWCQYSWRTRAVLPRSEAVVLGLTTARRLQVQSIGLWRWTAATVRGRVLCQPREEKFRADISASGSTTIMSESLTTVLVSLISYIPFTRWNKYKENLERVNRVLVLGLRAPGGLTLGFAPNF